MRFMKWSWEDYCSLPMFHLEVLVELIREEYERNGGEPLIEM